MDGFQGTFLLFVCLCFFLAAAIVAPFFVWFGGIVAGLVQGIV